MKNQKLMSEEAFNELIDNLEIVEKLTLYGRRSIKYHVRKLQYELKSLEDVKEIMNTNVKELVELKNIRKIKDENWRLQTDNKLKTDEIKKKDKIIKEMAKYIAKEDKTNKFCNYKTVCDNDCEECVEAYFRESEEE